LRTAILRLWAGATVCLGIAGCDHGLEATLEAAASGPTGISGRVTFKGVWLEEVEEVAVAVYRDAPRQYEDFFALAGADIEVEPGAQAYDYFVPVDADGLYRWVVVAWRRKDSFWNFTSLWGCYHLPGDDLPRAVAVRRGQVTRGIDIVVDFGSLVGETVPVDSVCMRILPPELLAVLGGEP